MLALVYAPVENWDKDILFPPAVVAIFFAAVAPTQLNEFTLQSTLTYLTYLSAILCMCVPYVGEKELIKRVFNISLVVGVLVTA